MGINKDFIIKNGLQVNTDSLIVDANTGNVSASGAITANNFIGAVNGNADTASALETARAIGGVSFDGTANIDLPGVNISGNQDTSGSAASLTTARTITIGSTGKTFNGTANVSWSLSEIGVGTLGEQNSNSVTITGGTIDNTVIGGSTPAAISGTTGSFSGNLTVDTNTLFVNAANNRVGIGTSSPQRPLHVLAPSASAVVGITSTDGIADASYRAVLQFGDSTWVGGSIGRAGYLGFISGSGNMELTNVQNSALEFKTNGAERMRIDSAGNVGIGTSSPARPLDVNGYLRATDILVGANNADFPGVSNTNTGVHLDGGFTSFFSRTDGGDNGSVLINRNNSDGALVSFRRDGSQIGFIGSASSGLTFATGGTGERMRITAGGNVGIGTSNPVRPLDVNGVIGVLERIDLNHTNAPSIRLIQGNSSSTGNRQLAIFQDNGIRLQTRTDTGAFVSNDYLTDTNDTGASAHRWNISGTERMRLDSGGRLGIGTIPTASTGVDIRNWGSTSSPSLIRGVGVIPATATGTSLVFDTIGVTYAASTAATTLIHYRARPADNFGAGATLTNQYGFFADNRMTQATNNMGFYSNLGIGSGRWNFYANGDAPNYFAGNVGIGTSSPSATLEVNGQSSSGIVRVSATGRTGLEIQKFVVNNDALINLLDNGNMRFQTNNTERMRITSAGNVGIGTSSPQSTFDLVEIAPIFGHNRTANANKFWRPRIPTYTSDGTGDFFSPFFIVASVGENRIGIGGGTATAFAATEIRFHTAADTTTTNGSERMRIDSSGNVGIGTGSPDARLDVNGDALIHGVGVGRGAGAILSNTALGLGALSANTTGTANTVSGINALADNTTGGANTVSGADALRDNTTGDENTAFGRSALRNNTTGNNNIGIGLNAGRSTSPFTITTADNRIVMGNNSHTDAYIRIAWTVTSDARDKAEFAPIPHGLNFVNSLQPTEYQFKVGGRNGEADGRRRYGFLAQDVLALEGDSPVIADAEDPENLKLHESYIVPVLVNAIKELTAQVEYLQSEVNALKGK